MVGRRFALIAALLALLASGWAASSAAAATPTSGVRRLPPVAQRTVTAVARQGPDGKAAAVFAVQTAPRTPRGAGAITDLAPSGSSGSGIGKALSGSGGGGMGWPLPVLLIVSLAIAVAFNVWQVAHRPRRG